MKALSVFMSVFEFVAAIVKSLLLLKLFVNLLNFNKVGLGLLTRLFNHNDMQKSRRESCTLSKKCVTAEGGELHSVSE